MPWASYSSDTNSMAWLAMLSLTVSSTAAMAVASRCCTASRLKPGVWARAANWVVTASRSVQAGATVSVVPWAAAAFWAAAIYRTISGVVKAFSSSGMAAVASCARVRTPFSSGSLYHCSARAASFSLISSSSACRVVSRTVSGTVLWIPPCWMPTSTILLV